jgi:HK97 family phage prohead protease
MGKPEKKNLKKQASGTRELYECCIRSVEGEGNERKFVLSFSSEEPYERWGYTEILDHTEDAVDLTRLNEIGCVLFNHNRDIVIGKIEKAWVENNRGNAEVEFDTDEESEKIYQKVKNGVLKGVSVGYRIVVWEEVGANKNSTDGRFSGPCEIAKKWFPYEISIVSVPADATVGVGRDLESDFIISHASLSLYERQIQINKNII